MNNLLKLFNSLSGHHKHYFSFPCIQLIILNYAYINLENNHKILQKKCILRSMQFKLRFSSDFFKAKIMLSLCSFFLIQLSRVLTTQNQAN